MNSYAFGCKSAWIFQETCLLPLLDIMNHAPDGVANARIAENANGALSLEPHHPSLLYHVGALGVL